MHFQSPVGRLVLDVENHQSSYEHECHARGGECLRKATDLKNGGQELRLVLSFEKK